jgi:hypothetical protein
MAMSTNRRRRKQSVKEKRAGQEQQLQQRYDTARRLSAGRTRPRKRNIAHAEEAYAAAQLFLTEGHLRDGMKQAIGAKLQQLEKLLRSVAQPEPAFGTWAPPAWSGS